MSGRVKVGRQGLWNSVGYMDNDWVRAKLEEFLATCEEYRRLEGRIPPGSYWDENLMRPITNTVEQQVPTVRRILEVLDPSLLSEDFGISELYGGLSATETATRKALAVLKDRDEWRARLAPDGPALVASSLHEWIWGAAAQFWDAGQCEAAVEYGAKSLNAHIQKKSGMSTADRELASEVFSAKLSTKNVRLWLPGRRDADTWRSRQDGLHLLAMSAFAGIRNVVAHSVAAGWSQQEALEYLAVLSVVARWVDETEVVEPGT
jgi:uncharacterized protein (TIGR02391 family)